MLIHTLHDYDYSRVDDRALRHVGCIVDVGCAGWDWSEFFIGKKRVIGVDPYEEAISGVTFFEGVLGPVNGTVSVHRNGISSTTVGWMDPSNVVDFRPFQMMNWKTFCNTFLIEKVAVLKLNIEGGEYSLLMDMDEHDFEKIDQIAVSLHGVHDGFIDKKTQMLIEYITQHGYTVTQINEKFGWFLFIKENPNEADFAEPPPPRVDNVTLVTGLWDLGRANLTGWSHRDFETYKKHFLDMLKCDIPMCIWIPKDMEEEVWKVRNKVNTRIFFKEVEDFKTWFPFFEKLNRIRTSEQWQGRAGWLPESPQGALEMYNPMMMCKMFMVNDSTLSNPFNTEYFYWIDGGLTSTVPSSLLHPGDVFRNVPTVYDNSIIHIAYPYEPNTEIHGFEKNAFFRYCKLPLDSTSVLISRGGFWGGPKRLINEYNSTYYEILRSTIQNNQVGADECLFTIAAYQNPDLIERFQIEGNGLVYPFFEAMNNPQYLKETRLTRPVSVRTAKSSIYVLGFNSPSQFERLCESLRNDPDFMSRPRKILINNSTDKSTFEEYDRVCRLYDFEELHFDNLGICGGRQYVAEHFDASDSDFYFFFEDDITMNVESSNTCKLGFRSFVPNLYSTAHKIMLKEKFDFLKLCFSEFYSSNNIQVSWFNLPKALKDELWPEWEGKEPKLDESAPLTKFQHIKSVDGVSYINGEVFYSNWPMIVGREGNRKMFLDTKWARPLEQTWMSHMYQLTLDGKLRPATLLATTFTHHRTEFYPDGQRREN